MNPDLVRGMCYIAASIFFVFGLKMLSSPATARKGNMVSAIGMLIAIVTALSAMAEIKWAWIIAGAGVGSVIGTLAARLVKMTSMPQMVGLFNGFGGLASLLVGWSEFHGKWAGADETQLFTMVTMFLTVLIGGVTFSGSLVAFGKLAGVIAGRPILYKGQNAFNAIILIAIAAAGVFFCTQELGQVEEARLIGVYVALVGTALMALALGVLSTIGIGGADMPVVICLLNSYSGLAACAAGFVINNNVLIVSGSLVGASGLILTNIMCKAMNRSLANVPYEQLVEPQDVNPRMEMVDVAIVIGANDVVNPAAREDENSPLWGMPVIDVDRSRTCIVLKRSLNPGFAGVDNPLFFKDNTRMLFGDAKSSVTQLVSEFKH